MIPKPFDKITTQDIEDLITNKVPENRTLEYKEQLPGTTGDDKKECTADVTALANTQGGDLLYGITEERDTNGKPTGIPKEARGLPTANPENEILRITNLIRDTTDPRLTSIQAKTITGFPDGPVILLRIPNSWQKPHMVTTNGRFYARSTNGKYPMDTDELRDAFLQTQELAMRIRAFRDQRTEAITTGKTPVPLRPGAKLILHLIPFQAMRPGHEVDIKNLRERTVELPPIGPSSGWGWGYNLDGFYTRPSPDSDGTHPEYTLVFSTGTIELVDTQYLRPLDSKRLIPSVGVEKAVIDAVTRLWKFQQSLGIQPPIVVMLTLTGITDYVLSPGAGLIGSGGGKVDRENLALPEVLIEDTNPAVPAVLRPVFDSLWQAAGWNECKHYPDGTWKPSP